MTPEAKPSNVFCTRSGICFFMKNTQAAPSAVPANGNNNPMTIPFMIFYL